GSAPLTVSFTASSRRDATGWTWEFGDGATSPQKYPVHTYTEAGNYTVKLSASNSAGRLSVEKPGYIHVGVPLAPGWRFHADLRNSGVYDGGGIHPDNTVRWNFTTGDWISSTPAVVDGVAYFGSEDYNLYAVDTYTGKEQWRFKTGSFIRSSPAVAAGVVYIGSQDHNLYAVDAKTGTKLWNFTTGDDIYSSSPAVENGVVYFGSFDTNLYAVDAKTGIKIWNFKTNQKVYSSPAIADGIVYFASEDRNLYAVDAATGIQRWNYKTPTTIDASPSVVNGVVYFGGWDNSFYALDAYTGVKKWAFTAGDWIFSSSPAVSNGIVYFGCEDGNLYALDTETGTKLWTFKTGKGVSDSPSVADGIVYFGSLDNNLYAVDAKTGAKVWSMPWAHIPSNPAVSDGVIYIGSHDSSLYAIGNPLSFNGTPVTGPAPLAVTFNAQSTRSTSDWLWDFGDGATSTEQNPVHTYTTPGVYNVNLSATDSSGRVSMKKSGYIPVTAPSSFAADFTVSPLTGTAPLIVKCTDESVGNPTTLVYDFGDGINVTGPNPTHTYRFPGVYTITLSIMKYNTTTYSIMGSTATKPNAITVNSVPVVPLVAKFAASP
ncbi:MAG: PQQ-binding-like beta-propeller repeat protein, partial [Methanomicrobiales archaeon]